MSHKNGVMDYSMSKKWQTTRDMNMWKNTQEKKWWSTTENQEVYPGHLGRGLNQDQLPGKEIGLILTAGSIWKILQKVHQNQDQDLQGKEKILQWRKGSQDQHPGTEKSLLKVEKDQDHPQEERDQDQTL